ncbi:phosphatase PAP2 family protein [Carnimonas nigrificans]|uniref:phosphatase PAP2 family protein n=1 Tax=Carnimonas nigrificans TaxID=64323 RepID=UPI0004721621|nr:phosphatase PAP2 family protein [Carnimonas nigrificans]
MREKMYPLFKRLDMLEWRACNRIARLGAYKPLLWILRKASWLGDYPAWIALCVTLPMIYGTRYWALAVGWGLCAAFGGLVYRFLKNLLARERPYISYNVIPCTMPPLDRYSFPSGHTLHAVMFLTLTHNYVPHLLPIVAPFAVIVMASRVVLGLHYLTDVAAGALLGFAIAHLGIYAIDSAFVGWF